MLNGDLFATHRRNLMLARNLFAAYRRNLADFLECSEDEIATVTARLAGEDFQTLAEIRDDAEEAAWEEARQDNPEWPQDDSEEEDEIADMFRRLRYEAGY